MVSVVDCYLFFCCRFSHQIIIYSPINITIGKGKIDGITAIGKCLIVRIASRELIDAMEKEGDETARGRRFNPHGINEEGQKFSMAEECARLLSNKREEGAKSNKKSNKREEQRDIRRRFWWVDKTEDKDLKKLK